MKLVKRNPQSDQYDDRIVNLNFSPTIVAVLQKSSGILHLEEICFYCGLFAHFHKDSCANLCN